MRVFDTQSELDSEEDASGGVSVSPYLLQPLRSRAAAESQVSQGRRAPKAGPSGKTRVVVPFIAI